VEIINKLLELKLLDVVFTTDGKEYVTPQQLSREILDELYIHGGKQAKPNFAQHYWGAYLTFNFTSVCRAVIII
jgi:hypothetical protein